MTAETIAYQVAFRKRVFAHVAKRTIAALSGKPELAARVSAASETILANPDGYWYQDFHPKTDAASSVSITSEVVLLNAMKPLTEAEDNAVRDAMDT